MKNYQEKVSVFFYSLAILYKTMPVYFFIFLFLILIQAVLPTIGVVLSIDIINKISDGFFDDLYIMVSFWMLSLILPGIITPFVTTIQTMMNQRASYAIQVRIMTLTANITDLKIMEQPEVHNTFDVLSKEASYKPLSFLISLIDCLKGSITLISLSIVLASLSWWLPFALLLPIIPVTLSLTKAQIDVFETMLGKGLTSRLIIYYLSVMLNIHLIKEIKMYGLSAFFMGKHEKEFKNLEKELNHVRKKQLYIPQLWNAVYLAVSILSMYWIVSNIIKGEISLGGMVGIIQSISLFCASCQWLVFSFSNLGVSQLFFYRLKEIENLASNQEHKYVLSAMPEDRTIKFENVSFSYNDTDKTLSNINLTLYPNDNIAIVGENGSGKSTLIKLLCRLYKPTEGVITMGGVDISTIDINVWYKEFSVLFQDFGKYNLSISENVTIGNSEQSNNKARFIKACEDAGFELNCYPSANHMLGREFYGNDLSGGQWQRLSLARSFFSGGSVIIFDEPTSAIDPKAEAYLFDTFYELSKGQTSIMITHRLGGLKHVNRIIVLASGELVEDGSPEELLKKEGYYSYLYNTQKKQYY